MEENVRIFIMGPVGVGKSHAIEHLRQLGYPVIEDPVIELGETFLSGENSLLIQTTVATTLLRAAAVNAEGIFDSCLIQSLSFVKANHKMGFISTDEYLTLKDTYRRLMITAEHPRDVYLYLDKPDDVIRDQIALRGRPYEQDNPFIRETNSVIKDRLVYDALDMGMDVRVIDVTKNYDELIKEIDKIIEEEK